VNGVIARWPAAAMGIRDASTNTRIGEGNLDVRNVLAVENATLFETGADRFQFDATANAIEAAAGTTASLFTTFATTPSTGGLDWTPATASPARTGGLGTFTGALATKAGTFVTGTAYRGAADPTGAKWWAGWTAYARN
jgi:hypothetical protein